MALSREPVQIQKSVPDLPIVMWGLRRLISGVAEQVAPVANMTQFELLEQIKVRGRKR